MRRCGEAVRCSGRNIVRGTGSRHPGVERPAKLPRRHGAWFHGDRRAWATARKHLPVVDVAAAGGWKSTATIQRCYQQPDEGTMLSVVLGGTELREKKA
jgi:hypothetical protein